METTSSQYTVVYGRLDFFAVQEDDGEGLEVIHVASAEEVRDLANQFINVIPDDLDWYQETIQKWNGEDRLLLTHQDDDTFYFSATLTKATTDLSNFHKFVQEFNHEDF